MKAPVIDMINKIPIFSRFTEDELAIMAKHMTLLDVNQDKILFNEGDEGNYICFVVDGRLDVIQKTYTNDEIVLNTLFKGQSFGEMSIIDNSPRSATVKATTKASFVTLTRKDFDLLMEKHPDIGTKILKGIALLLSKKLRQTSSRLFNYMKSAGE